MKTDLGILNDWIREDLPNDGEWWHDGDETFYLYAAKLLEKGFSVDEIKMMMAGLYHAVANEFGN